MLSVQSFEYGDKNKTLDKIEKWYFGSNWPCAYIIYNDNEAYVGETLDIYRRTEQHLGEEEFYKFNNICLISGNTFNKSVILDLESFLIKYMSADSTKKLTNANAGIVDHRYFYKEMYVDDFKEIWDRLIEKRIVNKTLNDIENSSLFKYSPYKTLNSEQLRISLEVLGDIKQYFENYTNKSIIQIDGGAGTGKTILAVYLIKLLVDINKNKRVWDTLQDENDAKYLSNIAERLSSIKKIGLVVPMKKLRDIIKDVFKTVDGLSEDMVLGPKEVVNNHYDILVVDETHRLYKRKNLPKDSYKDFDNINRRLMGDNFTKTENDLTELDWIIKCSELQILFYDENQTIRKTDLGLDRFRSICDPLLLKKYELTSQMRCKGGNGYYEYVRHILNSNNVTVKDYKSFEDYHAHVFDNVPELLDAIKTKDEEEGLCQVACGPGWALKDKIVINGNEYTWDKEITSIHKIQGFDLNYGGVIFGKEVYYNDETKRIEVDKKELKDNFLKDNQIINGDEMMRDYLVNIYTVFMTRGIYGTFMFAVDDKLREYLKAFFNQKDL